jgi:hypothetical protein
MARMQGTLIQKEVEENRSKSEDLYRKYRNI